MGDSCSTCRCPHDPPTVEDGKVTPFFHEVPGRRLSEKLGPTGSAETRHSRSMDEGGARWARDDHSGEEDPEVEQDENEEDLTAIPCIDHRTSSWYVNQSREEAPLSVRTTEDVQSLRASRLLEGVASAQGKSREEMGPAEVRAAKDAVLQTVTELVDTAYDILTAEMLLEDLERMLSEHGARDQWQDFLDSPLFERFARKIDYFYEAARACAVDVSKWSCIYRGAGDTQSIHGFPDPQDGSILHYRVRAVIDTGLPNVMSVANEVQLTRNWNTLVTADPEVLGRRTAHYMMLNYQMSLMHGMYKLDILNEIRRFSDVQGGFIAEYIMTADKNHAAYREPSKGHTRPVTELKNMWVACGPKHTVLIQVGKVKLPFSVPTWLAKSVGAIAGRFIVGGLVNNSLRAAEANSPWEGPLKEDKFGFYQRALECVEGGHSSQREPAAVDSVELASLIARRRFNRVSGRMTKVSSVRTTGSEIVMRSEASEQPGGP